MGRRTARAQPAAARCLRFVPLTATASASAGTAQRRGGFKQGFMGGGGRTDKPKDSAGPTSSGQMPASVRAAAMPSASISTEEPMTGSTCTRKGCGQGGATVNLWF